MDDEIKKEEYRQAWGFTAKLTDLINFLVAMAVIFATFCATILFLYGQES